MNSIPRNLPSLLASTRKQSAAKAKGRKGTVFILNEQSPDAVAEIINDQSPQWQRESLVKTPREVYSFVGQGGPVWIFNRAAVKGPFSHSGRLEDSVYSWHRDQMGSLWMQMRLAQLDEVEIQFKKTQDQQQLGILVGLELAAYSYKGGVSGKLEYQPRIQYKGADLPWEQAQAISTATNWARHLVNTPPNLLNPTSYSNFVRGFFKGDTRFKVQVWDHRRLKKENMGLILGVGQGSENPPCLVHISYDPRGKKQKKKPIAFVGKGITFDSGGLDIKPSAGMRLMKKDMGGSASCFAMAVWAQKSNYERPLDVYLALAENSVDSRSMRPSDVLTARSGMTVEIHNTDAEGRLVLADALDVAVTQKSREPEVVIDVATLTGAMRVALGLEIGGLCSNDDELAASLHKNGQRAGDLNWRMPLFSRYTAGMSTPFADIVNCTDGMGGAITAALFLEKFVRRHSWAHFDINAWSDKVTGAYTSSGGTGQTVQCLAWFLMEKSGKLVD